MEENERRMLSLSPSGDKAVGKLEVCALTLIKVMNTKVAIVIAVAVATTFGVFSLESLVALVERF